jgi:RNA polymerase sigma-70 factor (ECF subfamily)
LAADDRRQQIEDLFRTHSRGVGSYVYTRVGDAELAEAITSRVFLIVVRNFDQCTSNRTAWLWSIVRSELARHFRDRKLHDEIDESVPDRSAEPLEQVAAAETAARLRAAMERLTEEQQKVVYMKFFQQMANHEIAVASGLTASNVGVIVHRALKALRAIIEPVMKENA